MTDNLLSVSEAERDGIELIEVPGADRPAAKCPICSRRVPAFELTKLDEETATLRGAAFACGGCRTGWERNPES